MAIALGGASRHAITQQPAPLHQSAVRQFHVAPQHQARQAIMPQAQDLSILFHGLERGIVQPLVERLFRKTPHLPHLDRGDLAPPGLALDGVGDDPQIARDLIDVHHSCHGNPPVWFVVTRECAQCWRSG